jgi:hypothetical protein
MLLSIEKVSEIKSCSPLRRCFPTQTLPPWASIIYFTIANPSPHPSHTAGSGIHQYDKNVRKYNGDYLWKYASPVTETETADLPF